MTAPLLAPHAHLAWRDTTRLVVEDPAAPHTQVLIGNASPALVRWLRSCDGTRSLEAVLTGAQALGIDAQSALQVLETLGDAGLVGLDALEPHLPTDVGAAIRPAVGQDLEALALCGRNAETTYRLRRAHHVWIDGTNRVAHALVDVLAASHLGSLQVRARRATTRPIALRDVGAFGPVDADVGGAPSLAMRRHIARATTPSPRVEGRGIAIACDAHLDPSEEVPYREAGVPYLRVLATSRYATIGPLTLPGTTVCWSCIALHRTDADPQWPDLLAQFDQSRRSLAPIDSTFAMWVASEAASRLLQVIDNDDPSSLVNTTFHIDRNDPVVRRRTWRVHPDCPCQWRNAA